MSSTKHRMTYDIHHAYLQEDCKPSFPDYENPYMHHEEWRDCSLIKLANATEPYAVTYGYTYIDDAGNTYSKHAQTCRMADRPTAYCKADTETAEIRIEVLGFDLHTDELAYAELVAEFMGKPRA